MSEDQQEPLLPDVPFSFGTCPVCGVERFQPWQECMLDDCPILSTDIVERIR
jgi:hypothetical protein